MPEPQGNDGNVDTRLQHMHCSRMRYDVGRDATLLKLRTVAGGCCGSKFEATRRALSSIASSPKSHETGRANRWIPIRRFSTMPAPPEPKPKFRSPPTSTAVSILAVSSPHPIKLLRFEAELDRRTAACGPPQCAEGKRLGRPSTRVNDADLRARLPSGLAMVVVGEELGISSATVCRRARRLAT